jgi:hypothetical protein
MAVLSRDNWMCNARPSEGICESFGLRIAGVFRDACSQLQKKFALGETNEHLLIHQIFTCMTSILFVSEYPSETHEGTSLP